MAKRMCQLTRQEIRGELEDILTSASSPQYVCRSCARTCASQAMLCNPESIQLSVELISAEQFDLATELPLESSESLKEKALPESESQLKALKKELKKQKEYYKEMKKVLKKQQKILKKQQELELEFAKTNQLFHMQSTHEIASSQLH